eukprot:2849359-Rhodomonas_salina.3
MSQVSLPSLAPVLRSIADRQSGQAGQLRFRLSGQSAFLRHRAPLPMSLPPARPGTGHRSSSSPISGMESRTIWAASSGVRSWKYSCPDSISAVHIVYSLPSLPGIGWRPRLWSLVHSWACLSGPASHVVVGSGSGAVRSSSASKRKRQMRIVPSGCSALALLGVRCGCVVPFGPFPSSPFGSLRFGDVSISGVCWRSGTVRPAIAATAVTIIVAYGCTESQRLSPSSCWPWTGSAITDVPAATGSSSVISVAIGLSVCISGLVPLCAAPAEVAVSSPLPPSCHHVWWIVPVTGSAITEVGATGECAGAFPLLLAAALFLSSLITEAATSFPI